MQWLKELSQGWIANIEEGDFIPAYRHFEKLTERPENVRNWPRNSRKWQDDAGNRLSVIEDNVVHIRAMVQRMFDLNLFKKNVERETVEADLRQMWALLALAFGTCNEPGLLCTLVDEALEQLATRLVGFVEPKFETIRMQKATEMMAASSEVAKGRFPSMNPGNTAMHIQSMKRDHQARVLFSELARMYRGAFILTVAQVNAAAHHDNEKNKEMWLKELIKWSGDCGHPSCRRQLRVAKMPYGQDSFRWSVSVGVEDSRVGFPEER